jgi:mRNA-degrading endonuclease RelE of RelBE toxin-antitoxin system
MRVLVTPTFQRVVKKLHRQQKTALDEAVRTIASRPEVGETKIGELAGVQVYKLRMVKLLCLLAYRVLDRSTIKLLMVGPYQNFCRGLKRTERWTVERSAVERSISAAGLSWACERHAGRDRHECADLCQRWASSDWEIHRPITEGLPRVLPSLYKPIARFGERAKWSVLSQIQELWGSD